MDVDTIIADMIEWYDDNELEEVWEDPYPEALYDAFIFCRDIRKALKERQS